MHLRWPAASARKAGRAGPAEFAWLSQKSAPPRRRKHDHFFNKLLSLRPCLSWPRASLRLVELAR